jgi:hypothetical protein
MAALSQVEKDSLVLMQAKAGETVVL